MGVEYKLWAALIEAQPTGCVETWRGGGLLLEAHADAEAVVLGEEGVEQLEGAVAAGGADGFQNLQQAVGLEDDVERALFIDGVGRGLDETESEGDGLGLGIIDIGAVDAACADVEGASAVLVEGDGAGAFLDADLGEVAVDLGGHLLGYGVAAEGGEDVVALEDKGAALEVPRAVEVVLLDGGEGAEDGAEDAADDAVVADGLAVVGGVAAGTAKGAEDAAEDARHIAHGRGGGGGRLVLSGRSRGGSGGLLGGVLLTAEDRLKDAAQTLRRGRAGGEHQGQHEAEGKEFFHCRMVLGWFTSVLRRLLFRLSRRPKV